MAAFENLFEALVDGVSVGARDVKITGGDLGREPVELELQT